MKQQMGIVLDSLPDSWECERKTLIEKANDLKYNTIIPELRKSWSAKYKVVLGDLENP